MSPHSSCFVRSAVPLPAAYSPCTYSRSIEAVRPSAARSSTSPLADAIPPSALPPWERPAAWRWGDRTRPLSLKILLATTAPYSAPGCGEMCCVCVCSAFVISILHTPSRGDVLMKSLGPLSTALVLWRSPRDCIAVDCTHPTFHEYVVEGRYACTLCQFVCERLSVSPSVIYISTVPFRLRVSRVLAPWSSRAHRSAGPGALVRVCCVATMN